MLHVVILAGGSGNRLWPESRESKAKQFLSFEPNITLIESTVQRVSPLAPPKQTWILTGKSMVEQAKAVLPGIPKNRILAEPASRNTAPCIGWAAVKILREDPNATMIVLPADHIIKQESLFCETLRFAANLIEEFPDRLIVFGIKPTFPSTSYGYIQYGTLVDSQAVKCSAVYAVYNVLQFHEKPEQGEAKKFLQSGNFAWNAGIFVWKAQTILNLLQHFEPKIGGLLGKIADAVGTDAEQSVTENCFSAMKKISIDYAVMERAEKIMMIEAAFDWDDVGTWLALDRLNAGQHDANGNLTIGAELVAVDSANCIVRGNDSNRLVALLGVNDLIVIQTPDATLIAKKNQEESVRTIIEQLKQTERTKKWL